MFKKITTLHIAIAVILLVIIVLNWKTITGKVTGNTEEGGSSLPKWLDNIVSGGSKKSLPISDQPLNCSKPLKKGSTGPEVQQLQTWIQMVNKNALPKYGADGNFGQETLSALQTLTGASSLSLNTAQQLLNKELNRQGLNWAIQNIC